MELGDPVILRLFDEKQEHMERKAQKEKILQGLCVARKIFSDKIKITS